MKEKIKVLKEIWKNRRYRALIILILYFFFFLFVFALLGKEDKIPSDNSNKYNSYSYTINDEINVSDLIIKYEDNIYSKNDFPQYNFDLTLDDILKLIDEGILVSQNYIENSLNYMISSEQYNNLLDEKIESNESIYIVVYKDDKISRIVVDFTKFYGYDYIMDITVR